MTTKHPPTPARINLGHVGPGMPTKAWLDFAYAHAQAKDAVEIAWDAKQHALELNQHNIKTTILNTPVHDRHHYVMRPDLGCILEHTSEKLIKPADTNVDGISIVVSNGLSSLAIYNHATPFLRMLLEHMHHEGLSLNHDNVWLVPNSRVAIIDAIGDIEKPTLGVVIIGERPGLSSFDSLGVYLTYKPRKGRVNAERNCISNIRPPVGLSYEAACFELIMLMKESLHKKLSGVKLKIKALKQPG